jgi:hypothetical protein
MKKKKNEKNKNLIFFWFEKSFDLWKLYKKIKK